MHGTKAPAGCEALQGAAASAVHEQAGRVHRLMMPASAGKVLREANSAAMALNMQAMKTTCLAGGEGRRLEEGRQSECCWE